MSSINDGQSSHSCWCCRPGKSAQRDQAAACKHCAHQYRTSHFCPLWSCHCAAGPGITSVQRQQPGHLHKQELSCSQKCHQGEGTRRHCSTGQRSAMQCTGLLLSLACHLTYHTDTGVFMRRSCRHDRSARCTLYTAPRPAPPTQLKLLRALQSCESDTLAHLYESKSAGCFGFALTPNGKCPHAQHCRL